MKEIYAHIISFDWQSAVFAYDLGMPGFAELDILNTGKTIKSVEATGNGRLYLEELPAETQICLRLRYPGGEQALSFTTLPAPQGELINQFALIADPHISIKQENRKGRFFVVEYGFFLGKKQGGSMQKGKYENGDTAKDKRAV